MPVVCKFACLNNSWLCVEFAALSHYLEVQFSKCYCPNAVIIVRKCEGGKS